MLYKNLSKFLRFEKVLKSFSSRIFKFALYFSHRSLKQGSIVLGHVSMTADQGSMSCYPAWWMGGFWKSPIKGCKDSSTKKIFLFIKVLSSPPTLSYQSEERRWKVPLDSFMVMVFWSQILTNQTCRVVPRRREFGRVNIWLWQWIKWWRRHW